MLRVLDITRQSATEKGLGCGGLGIHDHAVFVVFIFGFKALPGEFTLSQVD